LGTKEVPVPPSAPDRTRTAISTSNEAVKTLLNILYSDGTKLERMHQRKEEIRHLFAEGKTKTEIARRYGISLRRVGQIIDEAHE
jgi:DNA-binding NarL/FixJ family response regulator